MPNKNSKCGLLLLLTFAASLLLRTVALEGPGAISRNYYITNRTGVANWKEFDEDEGAKQGKCLPNLIF